MFYNSHKFYNYTQLENCSLLQEKIVYFSPRFRVKFNFSAKDKKRIMQTSDLLCQFFFARPRISVVKKFNKITSFNIFISPSLHSTFRALRIIYFIRGSSRKKLVTFKFKRSGFTYLVLRDFVTLFPFKIKSYDFHDWRFNFVLISNTRFNSEFEKFNSANFYFNFFNLS